MDEIKKSDIHIWYTTPAIGENIEQLQLKINELIEQVNYLTKLINSINTPNTPFNG